MDELIKENTMISDMALLINNGLYENANYNDKYYNLYKKYKVLSVKHSVYKQQLIDKYGVELVKTPII